MMGRQTSDQSRLFYEFHLEDRVPANQLLRRINGYVAAARSDLHGALAHFYSHTGRPSGDPELMIRMLIVGYSYGIRSERRLCEEVSPERGKVLTDGINNQSISENVKALEPNQIERVFQHNRPNSEVVLDASMALVNDSSSITRQSPIGKKV